MYSSYLLEVTYIIYHISCSEGVIKFVRLPFHTQKSPLQDDIKLESMLAHNFSARQFTQCKMKKIHKICIQNK